MFFQDCSNLTFYFVKKAPLWHNCFSSNRMIWTVLGEGKTLSDGFTFNLPGFLTLLIGKVFIYVHTTETISFSPFISAWLHYSSDSRLLLDIPAAP